MTAGSVNTPRKRIGIYGGTFAPPHNGHVHAARCFTEEVRLDKLYIMPTFIPPHKTSEPDDDPADRLEMAKLAFSGIDGASVSDFEIIRGGKSYTVNTLEYFCGEGDLMFLCGTDMFLSLGTWYRPERIFELAEIAFMRRERVSESLEIQISEACDHYKKRFGARITMLRSPAVELSSTEVREALLSGRNIDGLVPASVAEYIRKKGLYGTKC